MKREDMKTDELKDKKARLEEYLAGLGSLAVAFSSGVDSTFLLKAAHSVLGDNVCAVTAVTAAMPRREIDEARAFCEKEGVRLIEAPVDVFAIEEFRSNPPERCYYCKRALFENIIKAAKENGFRHIAEGSNTDDGGDYRPGIRALQELSVLSPLKEAGLTKAEIRELSRELQLGTWDKPSFACLATRIAYGERITPEKLRMIEKAEDKLFQLGFAQFRVRTHGELARIELPAADIERLAEAGMRAEVGGYLRSLGFRYVSLDLEGYSTGSMNRSILG